VRKKKLFELLEVHAKSRDDENELSLNKPDPLMVAKRYEDEYISLICALFAYGKASLIVKFLDSLDFDLLDASEDKIKKDLSSSYYRFQNFEDVTAIFIALSRLKRSFSLEEIFLSGYKKENFVLDGISSLINEIEKIYPHKSRGYAFLISKAPSLKRNSPYKRWNMYLRWMVRKDALDMGLWKGVDKKDLLMPLDTHTFAVSKELNLLKRKSYDLKAVIELTEKLKEFDPDDPVKYDFALYRIGQEGLLKKKK